MVSGGTYGTEDIVHGAGYGKAILILLLTPILWSLPTAFMIGELSSALPFEGGYYAWVRRAMGNFWGFQEAWLSLVASIFDMAIYPTLFVLYLDRLFPWFAEGHRGVMVALAVVVVCALLNIAGVRVVSTTSLWLFSAIGTVRGDLCPCSVQDRGIGQCGYEADYFTRHFGRIADLHVELQGWDNASTIATEVERPQRTYPRAMLAAVVIVCLTYILPFAAMWIPPSGECVGDGRMGGYCSTDGRSGAADRAGGWRNDERIRHVQCPSHELLAPAIGDGRTACCQSFGKLRPKSRAPWVAILAGCRLGTGVESRLRTTHHNGHHDLRGQPLTGVAALIWLRIREPGCRGRFVPGGMFGAIAVGIPPVLLLGFAIMRSQSETVLGMSSFAFGLILMGAGVVAYLLNRALKPAGWAPAERKPEMAG
jgi:hypothetical protein